MKNRTIRGRRAITALLLAMALVLGSFAALPDKAYAASASEIAVGDLVKVGNENVPGYTGTPLWRVLDKQSDGSMLLMSEYLWKGDGNNNPSASIQFTERNVYKDYDWRGSKAENWCNNFELAVLKKDENTFVEGLTVIPTRKFDSEYSYNQKIYGENNKKLTFRGSGDNPSLAGNDVFFLSAQEAVEYLTDAGESDPDRNQPSKRVGSLPGSSVGATWLLRSTETTSYAFASQVKDDGEFASVSPYDTRSAARPVFWAKFADGTSFKSSTAGDGRKVWEVGEDQTEPAEDQTKPSEDQTKPSDNQQDQAEAQKAAEAKAKATTSVAISGSVVNAASIKAAIAAAGGRPEYVKELVIGKRVKKLSKNAFKGTKVTTLVVKSKKLSKKSVKGSLKGSKVKTVKVKIGSKKVNKKYVKKYKKIFTKKNAGKKVKVK